MKRILTNLIEPGKGGSNTLGQGFTAQSLDFLQDAFTEILLQLCNNNLLAGSGNFNAISGCNLSSVSGGGSYKLYKETNGNAFVITNVSGSVYTINGGMANISGELLRYAGSTGIVVSGSDVLLVTIVDVPDATADSDPMSDGSSQNVHHVRTINIVTGPPEGSGVNGYVCDYSDLVFAQFEEDWHIVGTNYPTNPNDFQNAWNNVASGQITRYKKDILGYVHLELNATNGILNTIIFSLPAGYIPDNAIEVVATCFNLSIPFGVCRISIDMSGTVSMGFGAAGSNINVCCSLVYKAAN